MSAVGSIFKGVTKAVTRAVAGVGKVITSVAKGIGKVVSTVGKAIEGTVKQALKDPIGTIAQIAAVATGQVWLLPVISAGQTIAAGGSLGDALKAAAISYAAGKLGSFAGEYAGGLFEGTTSKLASSLAQGAVSGASSAALSGRDIMQGLTSGLASGAAGFVANQYVAPYVSKNLAEIANITGDTNKFITGMTSAATKGGLAAELKGQDAAAGAISAMTGFGMKYGQDYVADAAGNLYDAFGRQINESNAESVLTLKNQSDINDYVATLKSKGLVEGVDFSIDSQGRVWDTDRMVSRYGGSTLGYAQGSKQFNPALLGRDVDQWTDLENGKSDATDKYGRPLSYTDYLPISKDDRFFKESMSRAGYEYGDDYTINSAGNVIDKYGNILSSNSSNAAYQLGVNEQEMGDSEGLLYTQEEREDLSQRANDAVEDYTQASKEFEDLQKNTLDTYNERLEQWGELGAPGEFEDFYRNYDDYKDDIAQYKEDAQNWQDNADELSLEEYRAAKEEFGDVEGFDDLVDKYSEIDPNESFDSFLGRYDEYEQSDTPLEFDDWIQDQYELDEFAYDPQGFDNIDDYRAWKETDLPAEEFREINDEFKQYLTTVDPFAPPQIGQIKYNPVTGQWEQEKLPTTREEFQAYRDNKITEAYNQDAANALYRDDLDAWRAQGSPGDFGLWRFDKYDGYAPTGESLLQQRYEDSGTNLSYEDWLDQSKQEFEENYIEQEKEYYRQAQEHRIINEEYNNLVESGDMPTGITLSDYVLGKDEWKSSGSDLPVGEWIADKQEWEASGSELPLDEWQEEKYAPPEPEPEEPFRVEIPETELAAPEGGELDPRTGIRWNQNEDGEWIGFDDEGNIYGEGGEQLYSPPEDVEGEVDPVSGITWYPSEDGSKIGIDEDGNYYNEDGSIFWQPDYSGEFEMEEGFTPDTEGATEFDPDQFEPVVEPGQTPNDIFGQIKDFLGGSFGQNLHKDLQRRLTQPPRDEIYGSGRSYSRTPKGMYQRAAQPLLGSGFDWGDLKAGEQPKFSEPRDEAFQAEKPEVGAPELFDPLKDTKWAPMSRIEGLGFAGKFINQEPISMSTFDQKSKPIQTQQVEQDTPMTTGWKTADELQAEKEQEQREQQFQPEAQDMFFDPTDVNLAQPWWQQPEFQQQQNTMPVYAAQGGLIDHNPQFYSEGGASVGMRHVKGDGDGTSDSVPAMLAADEYVLPADIVSSLGNGSSDAGANVLDQFVKVIREHKRNADPEELSEDSQGPLTYLAEAYERVGA